jgi:PucR family transcriptional regulator, purine catabolism regulatory protein
MLATLRTLLRHRSFHLRLTAGADPDTEVLTKPLEWAHSSDLQDPTPWLREGGLLLTDGTQFDPEGEPEWAESYVSRLVGAGVAALGFAIDVVHPAVPERLVTACSRQQLPLLEVGHRTPFMAIIRFVVDAEARTQRERLEWSLAAQRGVARAALRPDGLTAVLRELEKHLACWVILFDAAGQRMPIPTQLSPPDALIEEVQTAVRRALDRGARGGVRIASEGSDVTLQTLGQSRELRGVLAVGTSTPLDPAAQDLVTSVIALASIALDQSRTIDDARRHLRSGLFELMLSGAFDVAQRSVEQIWGPLPSAPIRVSVLAELPPGRALRTELELLAERRRGRLFFADHASRLVAVTRYDDTTALRKLWQRERLPAGCSTSVSWDNLPVALTEATRAAARASRERLFVRFEELVNDGMLGTLEAAGGAAVAHRMLQPLRERSDDEQKLLLSSIEVWLAHNCAWDPAAKQLGIHRHTLRNRIAMIERLLGLDLDRFDDRAELWAAVQLSSAGSPG